MKVLFRVDAGYKYGWGHFFRCKSISDELKKNYKCEIFFLMHFEDGVEYKKIRENILFIKNSKSKTTEMRSIMRIIKSKGINVLILDIRTNLSGQDILEIRNKNIVTAAIDDPSERRMFVDYSFYSPLSQLSRVNWEKSLGKHYIGWDWMPIRNDFKNYLIEKLQNKKNFTKKLLISMGASDPNGLVFKVINALDKKVDLQINLIIGISFKKIKDLKEIIRKNPNDIKLHINPEEITKLISYADIAICSFGMTAYELAYCSVSTLYLCISEDHNESAKTFEKSGFGENLGNYKELSEDKLYLKINQFVNYFLKNKDKFTNFSSEKKIDGLAASRISEIIINGFKEKSKA